MGTLKTIISILHRGFDKIKEDGRVMVVHEKSTEKLYSRLRLDESDEGSLTRFLVRMKVVHIKTSYHLLIDG